jgi:outer membrane lipoprotein SlyB
MHTPLTHKGASQHPMMIIAALAVILFCLAGTAAIMGWIPTSIGGNTPPRGDLTEADRLALASKLQAPAPGQQLAPQSLAPGEPALRQPAQPSSNYAPDPQPLQRDANYRADQVAANTPAKNWCSNCGNVESVREIHTRAQGSGVGAAGGAVLGGLLGNQVGSGNGRSLATVAGAVGGAVVGNQVEGNMKATTTYEIRVRLDDGTARTFHQRSPGWRAGDRVRIVKGVLHSVR